MKCLGRVQRTGMGSNGLSYPVCYHRGGSQRATQEMHICSEYETVSLVSHRSYLFYKTHLKAGNISIALNHALGKIRGHSSPYPLESWKVLPCTQYQVVQFGPTLEDKQDVIESCFGYRTEKGVNQLVILLPKSPFCRIQPRALRQPSGIHSRAIVCFLFERTLLWFNQHFNWTLSFTCTVCWWVS